MPMGFYIRTKEYKKTMSRAMKNRKFSKKHKENLSKARKKYLKTHSYSQKSSKNYHWKGGRVIKANNYILLHKPSHPFCDKQGYILEHRLVMEQKIKRYLKPKEQVHHINGIREDNRMENLKLFATNSEHIKFHHHL